VIRRANDTEYGLVAYVFSENMKRAMQVCERLEYGMVGLNRGLVSDPAAPFGGVKQSGLGREGGHEGMLEFMETQYISAEAGKMASWPISSPAPRLSPWPDERGVDLAEVARTADRTNIAREDVERHASGDTKQALPAALPPGSLPGTPATGTWITRIRTGGPTSRCRALRVAAANLAAANRVIPQVTHHDRADMRAVEAVRAKLKPEAADRGVSLTALAFHVKALARALRNSRASTHR
jgi:delta 1-pyrroline-5-carboxylate dehydrogenase